MRVVLIQFAFFIATAFCIKPEPYSPCPPLELTRPCVCSEDGLGITVFNCSTLENFDFPGIMEKTYNWLVNEKKDPLLLYGQFYTNAWPNTTFYRRGFNQLKFREFVITNTNVENIFLAQIPAEPLSAVQSLIFSKNRLKNPRPHEHHWSNQQGLFMSIMNCKNATFLDVSHNDLEMVDPAGFYRVGPKIFDNVPPLKLEVVDFSYNKITKVYEYTFAGELQRLKSLNLQHNQISVLERELFGSRWTPNDHLFVDLSWNNLKTLNLTAFKHDKRNTTILVAGNPLDCFDSDTIKSIGQELPYATINVSNCDMRCLCAKNISLTDQIVITKQIKGIDCNAKFVYRSTGPLITRAAFVPSPNSVSRKDLDEGVKHFIHFIRNFGVIDEDHKNYLLNLMD